MRALLALAGVLLLAASASAGTLKVPQQYETIQDAVNSASEGDTIVVSRGVYFESVNVYTAGLRILGKGAVIDGTFEGDALSAPAASNFNCFNLYAAGTTIQGFTFRNGYIHVNVSAPGCRVLKCVSRNASYVGILSGMTDTTEIVGNRIFGASYSAIAVYGSENPGTVAKNQVRQSGFFGIQVQGTGARVEGNNVASIFGEAPAIYVSGSGSVVDRNVVGNAGGPGIYCSGSGLTITANKVSWVTGGPGIHASGDEALVQANTVTVATGLLEIYGNGGRVLDNRLSVGIGLGPLVPTVLVGPPGGGALIGGDGLTVSGNTVRQVVGAGAGIQAYDYSPAGGSVITGNTVEDVAGVGFALDNLNNATVTGCRAIRCGNMGFGAGFYVGGSSTSLADCEAEECHGAGFVVYGNGHAFVACTATDSTIDGFRVFGDGNTFTSCSARGTGGQGFHNGGTNTSLVGGVYLDNRLDIANETSNLAFFSGGLGGVLYDTGGETTEPVILYNSW